MLRRLPVSRLSTQTTAWPSASSASQRCDPMNPAPPVTKTRIRDILLLPRTCGDITSGTASAMRDTALNVGAFLVVVPGFNQQVGRGVFTAIVLAIDAQHVVKGLAAPVGDAAVAAP